MRILYVWHLHQLFSNKAAFNTQSHSSLTSHAIRAQNRRWIACDSEHYIAKLISDLRLCVLNANSSESRWWDFRLITEPSLLTRCAWLSHAMRATRYVQPYSGPLTSSTLPLWTVTVWSTLQSSEHQNVQTQKQFLPSGNPSHEQWTLGNNYGTHTIYTLIYLTHIISLHFNCT